jgi:hypothetical protein
MIGDTSVLEFGFLYLVPEGDACFVESLQVAGRLRDSSSVVRDDFTEAKEPHEVERLVFFGGAIVFEIVEESPLERWMVEGHEIEKTRPAFVFVPKANSGEVEQVEFVVVDAEIVRDKVGVRQKTTVLSDEVLSGGQGDLCFLEGGQYYLVPLHLPPQTPRRCGGNRRWSSGRRFGGYAQRAGRLWRGNVPPR